MPKLGAARHSSALLLLSSSSTTFRLACTPSVIPGVPEAGGVLGAVQQARCPPTEQAASPKPFTYYLSTLIAPLLLRGRCALCKEQRAEQAAAYARKAGSAPAAAWAARRCLATAPAHLS